jgi:peroxiredoxin Q/BCP
LKAGQPAPAFDLESHPQGRVSLADFHGKQNVLLAFYPKDDTPGCTREMCDFSTDLSRFAAFNTVVLGISCDNVASHAAFAAKHGLSQVLLADPDGAVARAYGAVRGDRNMANRVLFLIDKQGIIRHVHEGMPDNNALLKVIVELGDLPEEIQGLKELVQRVGVDNLKALIDKLRG